MSIGPSLLPTTRHIHDHDNSRTKKPEEDSEMMSNKPKSSIVELNTPKANTPKAPTPKAETPADHFKQRKSVYIDL